MRSRAASDGAQEGPGVELRDDQLEGDVGRLVLHRGEGDAQLQLTPGRDHTWSRVEEGRGKNTRTPIRKRCIQTSGSKVALIIINKAI